MDREQNICDLVRKMEEEDQTGDTVISKYVTFSLRETIEKIDAYLNSKHTSGETDSMDREKPFFNIVTAAVNIWYRATDLDRKNIKMKATKKGDTILAFVVTILLQEFMRKSSFGVFLNEWGRVLARYGSAIVKFVEKDGELHCEVMPWNRMIVDPVDFDNNMKVEKLWFTAAQLRGKKEYDQVMVEDLIETKTSRETMDGQKTDNKSDYIELFEVHGNLPKYFLTGEENDEDVYVQQMHVISYIAKKEGAGAGKDDYDEFTMYAGKEAKDPYMITHLIKEDGRTLAIGAVEHLFEAQWMQNHTVKSIKDQLDLASKLIFQTSDGNFVGQNALNAIETGDILIHEVNKPLTELNNSSHDISALQSFGNQWKMLGMEINGINEAMTTAPKANTAWRQTQAALQEAHSLFELMTENKGLDAERMLREYIIPYLKKQMDTSKEISAILDEHKIKKIDSMYVPAEATRRVNKNIIEDILRKTPEDLKAGKVFTPEMQQEQIAGEGEVIQTALNQFENQRFISPSEIDDDTWKKVLKDFEWDIEVDITGENKDSEAILTTLTTMLQTLASLQGQPMPPEMRLVFDKILEETAVISPVELGAVHQEAERAAPPPEQAPPEIPQQQAK